MGNRSLWNKNIQSRNWLWKKAEKPVDKGFFLGITVENPVDNVDEEVEI